MNRKSGFTLVELMGVLVILSVLLLMVVPSITKTFQNSKEKEVKEYTQSLCIGLQSYMEVEEGKKQFPKTIKIEELKNKGYVRENITVPEDSKDMKCVSIDTHRECKLVATCG